MSGLFDNLNALTTVVTDQGTQIAATTNLANILNTSVNTLNTTVADQASTLLSVQTAITANTSNLATVTASVDQQQTQLTANTSLLSTVTSGLGTLGSTVASQGTTLQALQTTVAGNVSNLTTLATAVTQQGAQVVANTDLLDTVNAGLGTLTSTVASQANTLQGLQATVSGNVADVATLSALIDQQDTRITANLGVLDTLDAGVTALTGTVAGQGQTLQTLQNTLGTLAGDVASAGTQIALQATDIGALQASVGANVSDVAVLRATLGTTGSDVVDLQTQVTDHEVRITANTAQLGTLGATVGSQGAALTQQGSDLATAAANIASLQGLVTVQAGTLGTLGSTVAAQGTLLGAQDTRITANADAILSLRNMTVSGNAGPMQYTTPAAPTVATTTATNDVAVLGGQPGPVRVHNVADGQIAAGSTDAVNGGQLYDVGEQINGLVAATVQYDDQTHTRITLGGGNAAPVLLANVAPGNIAPGSTEAVNGGQLANTNATVATLRGDVTQQASELASARSGLAALGTTVTAQSVLLGSSADAIASLRGDAERGAIGPVRYADPAIPTVPNGGTVTQSLALVGRDPAPVSLHNVADAQLSSGSTDAVNGGQLFALAQSYQGLNDLAVRYDDPAHAAITLGAAGVPVALRNIAAGTLAAGSSEAATAGQLFDTNQNVGTLTNVAALQAGLIGAIDGRVGGLAQDLGQLGAALDTGARGPVRYADAANPTVPNGGVISQDITLVGASSGAVRLHGVADGMVAAGSFDAINGNQLFYLGNTVADALGSGFRYNPASGFSGGFTFQGQSYGSVQSVVGAIETSLVAMQGSGPGGGTGTGTTPSAGNKYFRANSTMIDSEATGFDSTAIGPASTSSGEAAIAVGRNAIAGGTSSVAIGDGAKAMNGKAVSIGVGNIASGDGAVAIGDPNYATGAGATALGKDNSATGAGAIALGNVNVASGDGSTAIGSANQSSGLGAAALGFTNVASGTGAIAIGTNNSATGDGTLAIGSNVVTNATDTLAIGNTASAHGTRAIAVGNMAAASATYAAAFGFNAEARDSYSTAVGTVAHAEGFGSTALGTLASASGFATSALGSGAIADKEGSVALGSASQTTRGAVSGYTAFGVSGLQQSLGEVAIARNIAYLNPTDNSYSPIGGRQITGVAAGSAETDAVNIAQLRGVSGTMGAAFVAGFGGGASYDGASGALAAPRYTLNGVTYSNVGDALQAINARLSGNDVIPPSDPPVEIPGGTSPLPGTPDGTNPTPGNGGGETGGTTARVAAVETRVNTVETRVNTVETRVNTVETRVTTVEAKADDALAASSRSLRYDGDDETSVTLGGDKAVTLHNLAAGTADTDAVNVAQMNGAMDAAVDAANRYTDQRVAALSFDLSNVNRDVSAGVAGAMAMAGMPQPYEEGKSMFSLGAGTFQGQSAVAIGMSRIMSDGHTIVKLGATYNSRKRLGANVGVGYQF